MSKPNEAGSMVVNLKADCAEFEATLDRLVEKMRTLADEAERASAAVARLPKDART